jgi:hypothetical protein
LRADEYEADDRQAGQYANDAFYVVNVLFHGVISNDGVIEQSTPLEANHGFRSVAIILLRDVRQVMVADGAVLRQRRPLSNRAGYCPDPRRNRSARPLQTNTTRVWHIQRRHARKQE